MNETRMAPADEHEFYGRPENQMPQGPPRRRPRPEDRPPSPALLETLDILSDSDTMSALAEAEADLAAGDLTTLD